MYRLLALGLAALLASCASSKRYTANDLPDQRLVFTWGGGFTGEYKSYMLLPNGQLFFRRQVIGELPYREVDPLDAKLARELFDTWDAQGFGALAYDDPGNMTYTVAHVDGDATEELTWGGTDVKPTEALRTYWRRVMKELKANGGSGGAAVK